jgi:glycosyltransferase involved in cell wall biosynthesis
LGLKHNADHLLYLSEYYRHHNDVKILVVSEGIEADRLRKSIREARINNLIVHNYLPYNQYPALLGSSDILVGLLIKEASEFSIPSKILSYLCAQRPILLAVPGLNMAARTVNENQAGFTAEPDDLENFVTLADKLYNSQDLREKFGRNGRKFAESTFDIGKITGCFESLISNEIEKNIQHGTKANIIDKKK